MKRLLLTGLVLAAMLAALFAAQTPLAAQEEFDLSEVLTTPDGSLSVNHPAGWGIIDDLFPGILVLGTSEAAISQAMSEAAPLEGDELAIVIVAPSATMLLAPDMHSAETVVAAAEAMMAASEEATTYGEMQETELGGQPAVIVPAETPLNVGLMTVIGFDGRYVLANVAGSVEGYAGREPLVLAILETLTYAIPEGVALFTTEAGDLALEHPAAWLVTEVAPGVVFVANGRVDPDEYDEAEAPDAVSVQVITAAALIDLEILEEIGDPAETAESFFAAEVAADHVKRLRRITRIEDDRAYVDFVSGNLAGYVLAWEDEAGVVLVWVVAGADALSDYAAEVDAVIDSIQYPPADD